jgi:Alkylmercury lyase
MNDGDVELRNRIYGWFIEHGRAPSLEEAGADEAALRRLHDAHALVLEPDSAEIRMLNPFSAVPTAYRVEAGGRSWYGNCVWDAFGIPAALGVDGHVSTTCSDCGEALEVDVVDRRPQPSDLVAHILLPARRWWDDIVFT